MNCIRIVLADDHAAYRVALARLLADQPGLRVDAQYEDGAALLQALLALAPAALPELVLLDLEMPRLNGLDTARALLAQRPGLHLLLLSAHDDAAFEQASRASGCLGFCAKSAPWPELLRAVLEVAAGRPCFSDTPGGDLRLGAKQSPHLAD